MPNTPLNPDALKEETTAARRRFPWVDVFIWSCATPVVAILFVVVADLEWW